MSFFPSLDDCTQAARKAFLAALPGANAWLSPNNVGPTAKVIGGAQWSIFQRLDYVGRQAFPLFAERSYLDNHGAQFGLARRLAQSATGNIVVTASAFINVAPGAQFARGDGAVFTASAAATLAGAGSVSVAVVGSAGAAGDTAEGSPMTILSGVTGDGAGAATAAVDSNGLVGGADVEPDGAPRSSDLSTFRGRILFRMRNPPQGGAPADYVRWATSVAGVTRVFVERCWPAPGGVRVFPIFDGLFPGGIADSGTIAQVQAAIAAVAPADAAVTVVAPAAAIVAVTISNLKPSTTATQTAVRAELADAFQRLGRVAGGDSAVPGMPYLATPFSLQALWIEQAVANATGVISADVSVSDVSIPSGSIPILGSVIFA